MFSTDANAWESERRLKQCDTIDAVQKERRVALPGPRTNALAIQVEDGNRQRLHGIASSFGRFAKVLRDDETSAVTGDRDDLLGTRAAGIDKTPGLDIDAPRKVATTRLRPSIGTSCQAVHALMLRFQSDAEDVRTMGLEVALSKKKSHALSVGFFA